MILEDVLVFLHNPLDGLFYKIKIKLASSSEFW
jgi:hypothetical protein